MKTDKELLELAAKAAGLNVKMIEVDQDDNFSGLIVGKRGTKERIWWNPLRSDGDAMRLTVQLCMTISYRRESVTAQAYFDGMPSTLNVVPFDQGAASATRRAIVRAAAAIGERL